MALWHKIGKQHVNEVAQAIDEWTKTKLEVKFRESYEGAWVGVYADKEYVMSVYVPTQEFEAVIASLWSDKIKGFNGWKFAKKPYEVLDKMLTPWLGCLATVARVSESRAGHVHIVVRYNEKVSLLPMHIKMRVELLERDLNQAVIRASAFYRAREKEEREALEKAAQLRDNEEAFWESQRQGQSFGGFTVQSIDEAIQRLKELPVQRRTIGYGPNSSAAKQQTLQEDFARAKQQVVYGNQAAAFAAINASIAERLGELNEAEPKPIDYGSAMDEVDEVRRLIEEKKRK